MAAACHGLPLAVGAHQQVSPAAPLRYTTQEGGLERWKTGSHRLPTARADVAGGGYPGTHTGDSPGRAEAHRNTTRESALALRSSEG